MPPSRPDAPPRPPADPAAELLSRAYGMILSWPCPTCGQPFPCLHDLAEPPVEGAAQAAILVGAGR